MVCNHGQTGVVAPSENGRLPLVLAHQLASARNFFWKNLSLERIAATEARAGQIKQGKGIDYREKTFNHGDHNEHKEDDAGRRNEQVASRVCRNEAPGR